MDRGELCRDLGENWADSIKYCESILHLRNEPYHDHQDILSETIRRTLIYYKPELGSLKNYMVGCLNSSQNANWCDKLGISISLMTFLKKYKNNNESVRPLHAIKFSEMKIWDNSPNDDRNDIVLDDCEEMTDRKTSLANQNAENNDLIKKLMECIDSLKPKEQIVIKMRFFEEKTLKEVGLLLSLSQEGVRQMEERILRKMCSKLKPITA